MIAVVTIVALALGFGAFSLLHAPQIAQAADGCKIDSAHDNIHHAIYIQFDNTHFTRDNPNVPSDLEQMPNLLHFITDNGVLLDNHHTPLIAHTATNILTSLTSV